MTMCAHSEDDVLKTTKPKTKNPGLRNKQRASLGAIAVITVDVPNTTRPCNERFVVVCITSFDFNPPTPAASDVRCGASLTLPPRSEVARTRRSPREQPVSTGMAPARPRRSPGHPPAQTQCDVSAADFVIGYPALCRHGSLRRPVPRLLLFLFLFFFFFFGSCILEWLHLESR